MTEFDKNGLQVLRRALKVLNQDYRRLPLSVYRVLAALAEAGVPCNAYEVARSAGFLLEHGRVKLHEAMQYEVVGRVRVDGRGVLWSLTDKGREELARVLACLQEALPPVPQAPRRRHRRGRGRRD